MRSAVTLYEFMPYGAPELLESRQRDMSRALMLTSLLALVACALAGVLASLIPGQTLDRHEITVGPIVIVAPPPLVNVAPPPPPVKIAAPPQAPAVGTPVPVADAVAPPSDVPAPAKSDAQETGPSGPVAPSDMGTGPPAEEPLPARGTWVYVEQEPVAIKQVKPEYPRIAQEAGVEGLVTVHVLVGKDGHVLDAALAENFRVPMLDQVALDAARRWVFTPGYANGHPVACWTAIPFRFSLH